MGDSDETIQYAKDPIGAVSLNYLHNLNGYRLLQKQIPDIYKDIDPTSSHHLYQGYLLQYLLASWRWGSGGSEEDVKILARRLDVLTKIWSYFKYFVM